VGNADKASWFEKLKAVGVRINPPVK